MPDVDPRNADLKVYVGGRIVPREEARVSVFDSVVQGGDAVWEGLRVYGGRIAALDDHVARLIDSAHALAFEGVPTPGDIVAAVFAVLEANGMRDGAHVRLTLTRGEKITSGMNPRLNRSGTCLIALAEWKGPLHGDQSLRLITSAIRRNSPQFLDSKIHHNNLLNNILACIQANAAGVDGALMLDGDGFLAETNDANVFLVRDGRVATPHADACLPGITRATVIVLGREAGLSVEERRLSLAECYGADEMFTTGTIGELTPVAEVDGRTIGAGERGPVTERLSAHYRDWARETGTPLPPA